MSKGEEYLTQALATVQDVTGQLATLAGDDAKVEALRDRLADLSALLASTEGRFFLRSKLCLPFARRCQEEAAALAALVASSDGDPQGLDRVAEALSSLELASRTLDERSTMDGMAIT